MQGSARKDVVFGQRGCILSPYQGQNGNPASKRFLYSDRTPGPNAMSMMAMPVAIPKPVANGAEQSSRRRTMTCARIFQAGQQRVDEKVRPELMLYFNSNLGATLIYDMATRNDDIWNADYKIPWDEPEFSRRMLKEHLSQEHDLASRRLGWIDQQVQWIHNQILNREPSTILDLGCGPGLYSHPLVRLGHVCLGIDFGPASIDYAREHNPHVSRCEFVLGDIRDVAFGGPYDLAMILYGELNVFSPADALVILRKARASLASQGRLIVEVQAPSAVERIGLSEPSMQELEAGLFSDRPHRCRTENQWLPEQKVTIQTFSITEANDGKKRVYRNTTKAWPDEELIKLLSDAGFSKASPSDAWPSSSDALTLWSATSP